MSAHHLTRRAALTFPLAALAQAPNPRLATDPDRPQYHFLPPSAWMNDPNAPVYHDGQYHLYYQHNPKAAKWDTMHWGHAVSRDLLHWTHRPIALRPSPGLPDKDGCWSGCMVINGGVPTILYTGVEPQTQMLATSSDFENWEKRPQAVIPAPPPGLDTPGFRDPHVWREGDEWLMMLGAGVRGQGGCVLLYSSRDLVDWMYEGIVHQGRIDPARTGGDVARGEMWECPDFFPVGDRYLLYVATKDTVICWLGEWKNRKFTPQSEGVLLGGAHYAPKSFAGPGGRRMIWSWIREQRATDACLRAGWAGSMSLAVVPALDAKGALRLEPAVEYKSLRRAKAPAGRLPEDCFELVATVEAGRSFALLRGGIPLVELKKGVLRSGRSEVQIGPARTSLQIFVDGSVIEVYANRSTVLAGRVYNTSGRVEVSGPRFVECWSLAPISDNRLTGM